ncbi:metal-dependent transcriptional regulator [Gimesia maris]|uniref:metal-dependent transcriptional regulator n=1 Tax=Gimesia maris TaxID=122 RepID=UPI0030D977FA
MNVTSLTVENYLKAILQISLQSGSEWISTGELARYMNVAPGTVTSMLKTLKQSKLVEYRPYEGASLTDAGKHSAIRVLRRHRLIELFLFQTLKLSWDQIHAEAENMEHAVSDFLVDHIDEYLGFPETDPHGDPIPSIDGQMRRAYPNLTTLAACPDGVKLRIVQVTDQEPEFLRFLSRTGLEIGSVGRVTEKNIEAGIVISEWSGQQISMGIHVAENMKVVPIPDN